MQQLKTLGRYLLSDPLASGGMATVHIGRLLAGAGFSRTVAIKRMHAHLSSDPEFVRMFVDEARLASRIRHPNVGATLDVVEAGDELFLVMEYIEGESLLRLLATARGKEEAVPLSVVSAIGCGVLSGLDAAHEAKSEQGAPLGIVHRDISPHNVLVGVDGVPRVVDFGIAKAAGRLQATEDSQIKGKLAYMAPEQASGGEVDRRVDVFATAVVLWEMVVGKRLFAGTMAEVAAQLSNRMVEAPGELVKGLPEALNAVIVKGLSVDPGDRFSSAREMAEALELAVPTASQRQVGDWVKSSAREALADRAALLEEVERATPAIETAPASRSLLQPGDTTAGRIPGLKSRRVWIYAAAAVIGGLGAVVAVSLSAEPETSADPTDGRATESERAADEDATDIPGSAAAFATAASGDPKEKLAPDADDVDSDGGGSTNRDRETVAEDPADDAPDAGGQLGTSTPGGPTKKTGPISPPGPPAAIDSPVGSTPPGAGTAKPDAPPPKPPPKEKDYGI